MDLGVVDPAIMYEAIGLASRFMNHDDRQLLQNKYINEIPFSALEGQALREAIIKLKNSSYTQLNKQQNNEMYQDKNIRPTYLLMTVNELFEMALEEKHHQDMTRNYENGNGYDEEQDEYEL